MRAIAVTVCLLMTTSARGQLPPAGPERAQLLDKVLKNWEAAMAQVISLEADCERTTEDKVFGVKEVYRGQAKYLKNAGPTPTSHASLYLKNVAKPEVYEHLIMSGQVLYEVSPAAKEIRVHELRPKAGKENEHNLVGLLFGMKAEQAKDRYAIELVGADANYYSLGIEAKLPADKADFHKAHLHLVKANHMPRQLIFQQANGNRVTWDLPRMTTPAAKVGPADFQPPNLPGFKLSRVPRP